MGNEHRIQVVLVQKSTKEFLPAPIIHMGSVAIAGTETGSA